MNHDRRTLETWARESGFRTDSIEKVVRLGELLNEVARHPHPQGCGREPEMARGNRP